LSITRVHENAPSPNGDVNASVIAYCDDILLLASNEGQMQRLINCCADFAKLWKLSFNPLKSSCYSIKPVDYEFILNGGSIHKSEGFIYLGLPVGTEAFVEAFCNEKMSKCEKALYSLKNIGCGIMTSFAFLDFKIIFFENDTIETSNYKLINTS